MPAAPTQPLQCDCGSVKGHVVAPHEGMRAICYCVDCQAYGRWLNRAGVLDADGGTELVATLPSHVYFTHGQHLVTCMSLSANGILRWYASCCNTPIGNTPRNPKVPYVGLLRNCLKGGAVSTDSFGPVRALLNTASATHPVRGTPLRNMVAMFGLMRRVAAARLGTAWKRNPFFREDGKPAKPPWELTPEQRAAVSPR